MIQCVPAWTGALSNGDNRLPGITRNKYAILDYGHADAQVGLSFLCAPHLGRLDRRSHPVQLARHMQVSFLGAYFMARSMGAKVCQAPAPHQSVPSS